jgi:hypothetical protein
LLGLQSLLDDANTGDIRLVCLEREAEGYPLATSDSGLGMVDYTSRSNRYRKRVLYAHSSIVKLRSEYLDDWIRFSSSDEQGTSNRGGAKRVDRTVHSVTCLDVDYVNMYWLLHFLYTGELEFKDVEDTASVAVLPVESLDRDIAEQLVADSPEGSSWDWKTLVINGDGTMAVETQGHKASPNDGRPSHQGMPTNTKQVAPPVSSTAPTPQGRPARTPSGARPTSKTSQDSGGITRPSSAAGTATLQVAPLSRTLSSPTAWQQTTPPRSPPNWDPHAHPTSSMPPASAFAIYALAHRYQLAELARLAQNHLLARLKPNAACSLLLASFRFNDLHSAVEDYVISHWDEIRISVGLLYLYHSPPRSTANLR